MSMPDPGMAVAAEVARLRQAVADLHAELRDATGEGIHPAAVTWIIADAEAWHTQLGDLRDWVDGVLLPHYGAYCTWLRDCWPDHPAALWELSVLWRAWQLAYERDRPSLAHAVTWHDRVLPGVTGRLEAKVLKDCQGSTGCSLRRMRIAR